MTNFLWAVLLCFLIITTCFIAVWVWQLKSKNAGMVDAVWGFSFPVQAIIYSVITDGFWLRKLVLVVLVCFWGIRLGIYLFLRNQGKPEDARYHKIRLEAGNKANSKLLGFFILQAVLSILLAFPFYIICNNTAPMFILIEILGASFFLLSIIGETLADAQLKHFKTNPENHGKVCNNGLWNYSRHPNYFFEWMIWVSIFIISLGSDYGFAAIISPGLMLHFLVNVTGIMMTEQQILISKGEAYRDYQRSTSAFVPWFKRNFRKF